MSGFGTWPDIPKIDLTARFGGTQPPWPSIQMSDLTVHRWQIPQPFDGPDAARIVIPVRSDVLDLARRRANIPQFPVTEVG
jgi:hypothetical protein